MKQLIKKHCVDITNHKTDPTKLLAYNALANVKAFYVDELNIICSMLTEYTFYLLAGNFIYSYMGFSRADKDMWDHRGK